MTDKSSMMLLRLEIKLENMTKSKAVKHIFKKILPNYE